MYMYCYKVNVDLNYPYQVSYSGNLLHYFYQEHVKFPWQTLKRNPTIWIIFFLTMTMLLNTTTQHDQTKQQNVCQSKSAANVPNFTLSRQTRVRQRCNCVQRYSSVYYKIPRGANRHYDVVQVYYLRNMRMHHK